uniref:Uncharacterized protein n=1 Tax=Romanomermis culicivorax TaxID=13658 RepID=A0A915I723_ROMCU
MKWMGQDLMNDKISDQMEEVLQRYPKICMQKSVQNLFCVLLIKWIPRSLKEPEEEQQTNLDKNTLYYMNCNFCNLFHFLNIHAASQNLIYWNVSVSIFETKDLWVPSTSTTFKSVTKWDKSDLIPQVEVVVQASQGPSEKTSKEQTEKEATITDILTVSGQAMDIENPEVVIIADPPIATTPAIGSKGAIGEERIMEIVETKTEKQPEIEKLTEQIKEMKEKIEMLEKEKYGKAAIKLAKQLENANPEEEETSEKPIVEVVSEIASEEDENPQANVLPAPPVYAKAGGQNVENIMNPEKFAKVMQFKRQMKEKRVAQEENKAELEKVKMGNFQQLAANPNDRIKYRRGLGKRGQALNKALKEGKYLVNYQYGRVSLSNPFVQKYLTHMVPKR